MALQVSQAIVQTGITPTAITASSSDTIAEPSFGPNGVVMRIITTGTATNVSVLDPNPTDLGNPGTVTPFAAPATGARLLFIPRLAINGGTNVATVTFSSITGVTYELYRW